VATQGEIAAASGAIRKAINKISEVLGVQATHKTKPTRDLDAILKRVERKHANEIRDAMNAERAMSHKALEAMSSEVRLLERQLEETIAQLRDRDDELDSLNARTAGQAEAHEEVEDFRDALNYLRERKDEVSRELHLACAKIAEQRARIASLEAQLSSAHGVIVTLSSPKQKSRKTNRTIIPRGLLDLFGGNRPRPHLH
jgi:chromosome segregation ATPase